MKKEKKILIISVSVAIGVIAIIAFIISVCGGGVKPCGCPKNAKCECEPEYLYETQSKEESIETTGSGSTQNTLKKGVMYFCGQNGTDSSSVSAYYNKLENTFELPEYESFKKANIPDKTVTIGSSSVTLSYYRTYRPKPMSYYIDEYVDNEHSVEIGYLENTDTIYTLDVGNLNITTDIDNPTVQNDYVDICRNFMSNNPTFNNYRLYRIMTTKLTINEHGIGSDVFQGFVSIQEEDGVSVKYEIFFMEYFNEMETYNTAVVTLNGDGSLDSFTRGGIDDFSNYSPSDVDVDYIIDTIDEGIQGMFSVSDYTLADYSDFSVLMVIEGKLCVMSMITPTVKIESTGKTVSLNGTITLLLPLT